MKLTQGQSLQHIRTLGEPLFFMTIGLPGSGKSTYMEKLGLFLEDLVITSTDDLVEREAKKMGLTYTEAFHKVNFKAIQAEFKQNIAEAARKGFNICIDQTNMSSKARRSKLELIPSNYYKIGLSFDVPEKVLRERLDARAAKTGKVIGPGIIKQMLSTYSPPSKAEGFDAIWEIQQS